MRACDTNSLETFTPAEHAILDFSVNVVSRLQLG